MKTSAGDCRIVYFIMAKFSYFGVHLLNLYNLFRSPTAYLD